MTATSTNARIVPDKHRRTWAYSVSAAVVFVAASLLLVWGTGRPPSTSSVGDELRDRLTYVGLDSLDGTWNVGTGSFAGYQVDEVLKGLSSTANGVTDSVTGQVDISNSTLQSASVDVNLVDVHSSFKARDDYFASKIVDTNLHPMATFRSIRTVDLGELMVDTSGQMQQNIMEVDVPGEVSINGVTAPVSAQATVIVTEHGIQVKGRVPMTWKDFGITPPSMPIVKVSDTGELQFLLLLSR